MDIFVKIHLEAEDYVIGVDRMPIRKVQAMSQLQSVSETIRRHLPRLRQGGLSFLRKPVDVDQIAGHLRSDFPGRDVSGGDRVKSLWLRPQRYDQMTTRVSDLVGGYKDFFGRILRPGPTGGSKCVRQKDNKEGAVKTTNTHTTHLGAYVRCRAPFSCNALAKSK